MRSVAFLRGINVGNRRPKKEELIAATAGSEFADVTTFQASGNLIFDTDMAPSDVEPVLERRLLDALGYEVTCFVRTIVQLRVLLDEVPPVGPDEKHQIIFYRSDPGDAAHAALAATSGPNDTLRPRGSETIWTHRGSMLDSPIAALTPKPGAPVTTVRTLATIDRIVTKFS